MIVKERYIEISEPIKDCPEGPVVHFGLASYFRVRKVGSEIARILEAHGLGPYYDPVRISPEIEEKLWEDKFADKNGYFTFLPQRLILGHTAEGIIVPPNLSLRMRDHFMLKTTGEELPLTTSLGAPLIHPGSIGPQTYEIYNESSKPLRLRTTEVICLVDVYSLKGDPFQTKLGIGGNFNIQTRGEISLGGDDWENEVIRRKILSRKNKKSRCSLVSTPEVE